MQLTHMHYNLYLFSIRIIAVWYWLPNTIVNAESTITYLKIILVNQKFMHADIARIGSQVLLYISLNSNNNN